MQFVRLGAEQNPRITLAKPTDSTYELTIARFEKEDAGEFKCIARNAHGESDDVAYIESEFDQTFAFRTKAGEKSEQNDLPGNPRVTIKTMGSLEESNNVELDCNLEDYNGQVKHYSWAKYPQMPQSAQVEANRLHINAFNAKEDSGLYTCRASSDDGDYQKTKLVASNDYLLAKNPYFSLAKEDEDSVLIKCRPGLEYTGSIEWQQPQNLAEDSYKIEGSDLVLTKSSDGFVEHHFVCVLKSDAELGTTKLDLEVNKDLFDRVLATQSVDITGEKEIQEGENTEIECTPGENC